MHDFGGRRDLIDIDRLEKDLQIWRDVEEPEVFHLDRAAMFSALTDPAVLGELLDTEYMYDAVYSAVDYFQPIDGVHPHPEVKRQLEAILRHTVTAKRDLRAEIYGRWHLLVWFGDRGQIAELANIAHRGDDEYRWAAADGLMAAALDGSAEAKEAIAHLLSQDDLDTETRYRLLSGRRAETSAMPAEAVTPFAAGYFDSSISELLERCPWFVQNCCCLVTCLDSSTETLAPLSSVLAEDVTTVGAFAAIDGSILVEHHAVLSGFDEVYVFGGGKIDTVHPDMFPEHFTSDVLELGGASIPDALLRSMTMSGAKRYASDGVGLNVIATVAEIQQIKAELV